MASQLVSCGAVLWWPAVAVKVKLNQNHAPQKHDGSKWGYCRSTHPQRSFFAGQVECLFLGLTEERQPIYGDLQSQSQQKNKIKVPKVTTEWSCPAEMHWFGVAAHCIQCVPSSNSRTMQQKPGCERRCAETSSKKFFLIRCSGSENQDSHLNNGVRDSKNQASVGFLHITWGSDSTQCPHYSSPNTWCSKRMIDYLSLWANSSADLFRWIEFINHIIWSLQG